MIIDVCWTQFRELNFKKRWHSASLTSADREAWRKMRCFVESWTLGVDLDPSLDTRDWLRVPTRFLVCLSAGDRVEHLSISTLGEGGCFVHTADPLEEGTDLELEIKALIDLQRLVLRGRVVWKNNGKRTADRGMGVEFIDLTDQDKLVLYQLVDQLVEKMVAYGVEN